MPITISYTQEHTHGGIRYKQCIRNVDCNINLKDCICYLICAARGFGWTTVAKSGNDVVRWARVNGYLEELGFSQLVGKDDYIPESLFYLLGMKANNPTAQKYQKWLAIEVIPQIRKTGGYIPVKEDDDELTIMSKAFIISQKTIEKKDELIANLTNQIEQDKPYADKAKAIESAVKGIMVGNYARLLKNANINFGRTELFAWLRNKGYLITQINEKNNPKERWLKQGIFTLEQDFKNGRLIQTTMITGKGQLYLLDKIVEDLDLSYIKISKILKDFILNTYVTNGGVSPLEAKLMMLNPAKYEEQWENVREMAFDTGLTDLAIEIDDILEEIC